MKVKLYRAGGMSQAMAQVRDDLGPDALILATRRVSDGVEVTAALEAVAVSAPEPIDAQRIAALDYHRVPAGIMRKLAAGPLPFALTAAFRFSKLQLGRGCRPLLLVGPPGGGKTLTAARLAARLVMKGVKPVVITADDRRAGAVEQLAAFTRVLGLRLIAIGDAVALQRTLADRPGDAPVLIDAPGLDPFDPSQADEITALAEVADATVALVLPAGIDPAEAADLAAAHAAVRATLLITTRLDLARRLGSVLAAADTGLVMTEAGIGPGVADGLIPMTAAFLAQRLLRTAPKPERRI
jgi:flagellar biosynthesis protein FlhF